MPKLFQIGAPLGESVVRVAAGTRLVKEAGDTMKDVIGEKSDRTTGSF